MRASEQSRADARRARDEWTGEQPRWDHQRRAFLDETATATSMTRQRGRSPRGQRCAASVPRGHYKSTPFIAGLRHDSITASLVLDGPMNGAAFLAYAVRQAIEATGATLRYLPPYSPDLNPIEKMFSKLKALLRKAAKRTVDGLWTQIGKVLDLFTPAECADYFTSCGHVDENR